MRTRTADEAAPGNEALVDATDCITGTVRSTRATKGRVPEGRVEGRSGRGRVGSAAGGLRLETPQLRPDEARIDVDHAIGVRAVDLVGVREANARSRTEPAL